ncbi:uncharacterized protein LOC123021071 [Varanus komodoensis]|uniref:uncharacterized protein LOC123021071 n=1 Tax=Varanus komodoensis TaxID=61221 RepID=UPI001CF787BF|nr:uncharacterized protein LOC123021071 [Varanus komodoensis]
MLDMMEVEKDMHAQRLWRMHLQSNPQPLWGWLGAQNHSLVLGSIAWCDGSAFLVGFLIKGDTEHGHISSTMPKRKTASSLKGLCLEKLAAIMQHFSTKIYTKSDMQRYHTCSMEGPFRELAGSVVQELLQLLRKRNRLAYPVLCWLLVPQLVELDLDSCPELVSKDVAAIVTGRCTNLSTLTLRNCSLVSPDILLDLVKGLPRLLKLDLSNTQCDIHVLAAVGACCQQIRELNISCCKRLPPSALLHLAYDLQGHSFLCPALEKLTALYLGPGMTRKELVSALAFVLLALPSLKVFFQENLAEALCMVHLQNFASAQIAPGFPSLDKLVQNRLSTHTNGRRSHLTLPLKEIREITEPYLRGVSAVCPDLEVVTVLIRDGPSWAQILLSWRHVTQLNVCCKGARDLRQLLPVLKCLGTQLESLSFSVFSLEDELAFPLLLSHCPNLQKMSTSLFPPLRCDCSREPDAEALGWDFQLAASKFPPLCDLDLCYYDTGHPLPAQHAEVLRRTLVALLKQSPGLERLRLFGLPFSLDEVFAEVLEPPNTALVQLQELSLMNNKLSVHTIHQLLSSENQLRYLTLQACSDIHKVEYEELSKRIWSERLDLFIFGASVW